MLRINLILGTELLLVVNIELEIFIEFACKKYMIVEYSGTPRSQGIEREQ